jgi:hypothetical protein
MRLDPIGMVDDPASADLEPITVPICGLHAEKRKNVCEEFNFRPTLPYGYTVTLLEAAEEGREPSNSNVRWLSAALMGDEERQRFWGFLQRPDVEIEQTTINGTAEALAEAYAARPTLPRTGSSGTGGSTKRTSTAASRAQASRSRKNHLPSRST